MFFIRLMNALMILLMLTSIFGIAAAFGNANLWQLIISLSMFVLSSFSLLGTENGKKKSKNKNHYHHE